MPGWNHTPETRARESVTYGPEYRHAREAAKRRSRGYCEGCHHRHSRLQCDHINNVAGGAPDHSLSNLQMLCHGPGSCQCHEKKTAGEGNAAQRGGRAAADPEPVTKTAW